VSAVLTAQEPSAKYLVNLQPPLVRHFDLIAQAPGGVARLRELILTLAVQGKLVPQDPSDEPASELIKKIRAEKDRLIAEGKIKRDKPLAEIEDEEKPFELPVGWAWERFGAIAGIERGGSPRPIESFLTDDPSGLNWIKIGDTEKGGKYITSASQKIKREGLVKTRMVYPGDFLLTNSMSFGRPYITQIEGCIHDGWLRISPPSSLDKDFLYALLSSRFIRTVFEAAAAGAVVLNLNADKVRTVPIPMPPLAEQSRIVTRVEELMQLCDALEASGQLEAQQHAQLAGTLLGTLTQSETPEALADNWQRIATHFDVLFDRPEAVDALEQTILQLAVRGMLTGRQKGCQPSVQLDEVLTKKGLPDFPLPDNWRWSPLGDLAELINGDRGQNYPNKAEYVSTGIPFINTGHIDPDGSLSSDRMNFLTREKFDSLRGGKVRKGDLVYCLRGATLGKTAIVDYEEGAIASSLVIIRPISELNNRFAYLYLTSPIGRSFIWQHDNGSAQPNLAAASLKKYWIPLPPLVEQIRIVTRVNELRALCADLRQRLSAGQAVQSRLADALVTA
jgi:type I restriction enzyme, S subunit